MWSTSPSGRRHSPTSRPKTIPCIGNSSSALRSASKVVLLPAPPNRRGACGEVAAAAFDRHASLVEEGAQTCSTSSPSSSKSPPSSMSPALSHGQARARGRAGFGGDSPKGGGVQADQRRILRLPDAFEHDSADRRPRTAVTSTISNDAPATAPTDFVATAPACSQLLSSPLFARRRLSRPQPLLLHAGALARDVSGVAIREKDETCRRIRQLGDQKIYDLYSWDEVLQEEGNGGKVVACRAKTSNPNAPFNLVMKIKAKDSLSVKYASQYRRTQERVLNLPPHAGILPLHEVLEDDKYFYAVMERATCGDFFCGLMDAFPDGDMPASAVRGVVREILEAVGYVHKQGMLHRDIKPDNLVMNCFYDPVSPGGKGRKVMLIDFDLADTEWDSDPMSPKRAAPGSHNFYGTMRFNAPETFIGNYSQESDLYSVGCILYLLMSGQMPRSDSIFDQLGDEEESASPEKRKRLYRSIYKTMSEQAIPWDAAVWVEQPECANFCKSLIEFDPLCRPPSAEDALQHKWCTMQDPEVGGWP